MISFDAEKRAVLERRLRRDVDAEIRFDSTSCRLYSTDAGMYQVLPLGVVMPRSEQGLIATVQLALESRTPIVPRGGGTSLTGQSIGAGLVVDCSKCLNRVEEFDPVGRRVRVRPGLVLDHLNRAVAGQGLQFGPDVATIDRATIGGMLGNNSAGSRSIVYGQTVHHVHSLRVVYSDGRIGTVDRVSRSEWDVRAGRTTVEGAAYRAVRTLVADNREEIVRRFPNILRRVSGYNLAAYLPEFADPRYACGPPETSLIPALVGSEGTLAFLVEAELNLVPRPSHRVLLVPHFDSLDAALAALHLCLEASPSAVELVDALLIRLARGQRSLRRLMQAIEGEPAALLMVEFAGESAADVAGSVDRLADRLQRSGGLTACVRAIDPSLRDPLWKLRSAAVPLLYGLPGKRKPATFVEDCAVDPKRLPEFARLFREILQRHGTDGAYYGHASVGCLHIRPMLDMHDSGDVGRMTAIAEDVSTLVREFGGSLSGEHGDGLARSAWNRKMYGDAIYGAFQSLKRAFDPHNLFNPGKVVDAPAITEHLRYREPYRPIELPVVMDYSKQGGFLPSVELCNGAGVCRKTQGGAMCPSYRATLDEVDSTRGRANALRFALSGQATGSARSPLAERWLYDVMDRCLGCKACKTECPSNVDLAKLKAEFLQAYHREHRRPIGMRMVARTPIVNRWGAWAAPLVNWINRRGSARRLMEAFTGFDRRRPLPQFHRRHFRRWFDRRPESAGRRGTVVLLDDCLTTYLEPQIGTAAVTAIEAIGFRAERADLFCCGRPLISKGYLDQARALVERQAPALAARLSAGVPLLGLEPSCASAIADEWTELLPGDVTRRIAEAVAPAEVWIADRLRNRETDTAPRPTATPTWVVHGHCQGKSLGGSHPGESLRPIPGSDVHLLDAGCCGMAGSFGYEREHYDLSVRIAELGVLPALSSAPPGEWVADGTSCRHQIRDLTGRTARHPVEILAEALGSVAGGD